MPSGECNAVANWLKSVANVGLIAAFVIITNCSRFDQLTFSSHKLAKMVAKLRNSCCACMYACVRVCSCVPVCVRMAVWVRARGCVCACMHACMYVCACVRWLVVTHMHVCARSCDSVCARIYNSNSNICIGKRTKQYNDQYKLLLPRASIFRGEGVGTVY